MKSRRSIAVVALLVLAAVNAVAYAHARAMLTWAPDGARTPPPEQLSTAGRLRTLLLGVRIPRPRPTRTPDTLGLPFEAHTLTPPGEPALSLWEVPVEDPRGTVVLIHGYTAAKDQLLELAPPLREMGWRVVLVDLRGSGDSGGTGTTIGVTEARDVAAVAAWAPRPVVLYGFSMGAAAALRAVAAEGATPDGLILEAVFDRLRTTVGNRFRSMGLPARPGADLLLFWGGIISGFDPAGHAPVSYATRVRAPTLVLHGTEDPRAHLAEGRAVYDALAGPSRWVAFEGLGHELSAVAQPARWGGAVGAFLEARAPQGQ
ncbi:MAG: alpha/beta fold hydrolase [Alphaproteobacteria bacterium]|nr:alpha/beta fold hydrolase [Alphaproteobacteria bacterium]